MRPAEWWKQRAKRFAALCSGVLAFCCTGLAMAEPQTLRVVTDENYPPYLFKDAQGQHTGYLVDLWALWSQKTGVPVDLQPMQWSQAQSQVLKGQADVIDMIYRTPVRETLYAFSEPYATLPVAIYSHTSITGVSDLDTLRGFQVGVQAGDACAEHLQGQGISTLRSYPNYNAMLNAASQGEIRLFCLDVRPAAHYLYQRNQHRDFLLAFELYQGRFHQAVRKGQEPTLALVRRGMAAITPDEYQALHNKWLRQPADWTTWGKPTLVVVGLLLLVATMLLLWSLSLRRMVRLHTATIEAERSRVKNILDTLPDLVWVKDPGGRYLACNKRFEQLFGAPEADILGKTDFDFVDAPLAQFFRSTDLAAMQTNGPRSNLEDLTFASDGHLERVETIKTPLRDADGHLVGVIGTARNMTDVLATQQALQDSLARLEEAERIARIGHWDILLATGQMHWSPEVYHICGLDHRHQAPDFDAVLHMVHPEDRARVQTALVAVGSDHPVVEGSLRLVTPGDTIKHLYLRSELQTNARGTPWRRIGMVQDITERVRTEQELQTRNEIFAAIANRTTDSIALIDPDSGRFIEFNRAAHENLGYTAEVFNRMRVVDIDVGHSESALQIMLQNMREPGEHVIETQHRHRDGSLRDIRVRAQAIHLHDRTDLAVIWTDITTAKAQTAELEALRHHLQQLVDERTAALQALGQEQLAIFESAPVGIVLMQERVVVKGNRQLENLFGYGPGEMTGLPARVMYDSDATDQAIAQGPYLDVLRGHRHTREQRLVRRDGTHFWARITVQLLNTQAPEKGVLGIIEDIEHEHAAAEALRQGKAMAEAAAQVKSDFLANMSHEIRTPMNAILGMAHLALQSGLNPRQQDYISQIQTSGKHLLALLNNILDFSKIEAGKLTLEHLTFTIDSLLANMSNLVGGMAHAKGLALAFDVGPEVPRYLVGDALRLGQVLVNFGSNAVKFTSEGEVSVRVRLQAQRGQQVLLRFEVRDTGMGMSPEQCRALFQPFVQADTSTTRKFGGTGLGLSIAKQIAEAMGGEVGVESALGVGSTFWCTAWLETAPDQPQAVPAGRQTSAELPTNTSPLEQAHTGPMRELCMELQALLESGDTSAQDWVKQHKTALTTALGPRTGALLNAVDTFDFALALEQLRHLLPDNPP